MSLKELAITKNRSTQPASYVALLDEYLESRPFEHRPGYHPSSLSYKLCPKQEAMIQLKMLEPTKDIDGRLARIFATGHAIHDRFQAWSAAAGLEVEHPEIAKRAKVGKSAEVKLKHPVGISSSTDHILQLEEGWWDVIDYKSINPYKFKTLIQPISYHEKQLTVYVGLVNELFWGEPPAKLRGRMVYENKADSEMKEFVVPWDEEHQALYDGFIEILGLINIAVEEEDPDRVDCTCGSCPTGDYEKLLEKPKKVKV